MNPTYIKKSKLSLAITGTQIKILEFSLLRRYSEEDFVHSKPNMGE